MTPRNKRFVNFTIWLFLTLVFISIACSIGTLYNLIQTNTETWLLVYLAIGCMAGVLGIILYIWITLYVIKHDDIPEFRKTPQGVKPMFKELTYRLGRRNAGLFLAICLDCLAKSTQGVDSVRLETLELTINDCNSVKYDFDKDTVVKEGEKGEE